MHAHVIRRTLLGAAAAVLAGALLAACGAGGSPGDIDRSDGGLLARSGGRSPLSRRRRRPPRAPVHPGRLGRRPAGAVAHARRRRSVQGDRRTSPSRYDALVELGRQGCRRRHRDPGRHLDGRDRRRRSGRADQARPRRSASAASRRPSPQRDPAAFPPRATTTCDSPVADVVTLRLRRAGRTIRQLAAMQSSFPAGDDGDLAIEIARTSTGPGRSTTCWRASRPPRPGASAPSLPQQESVAGAQPGDRATHRASRWPPRCGKILAPPGWSGWTQIGEQPEAPLAVAVSPSAQIVDAFGGYLPVQGSGIHGQRRRRHRR